MDGQKIRGIGSKVWEGVDKDVKIKKRIEIAQRKECPLILMMTLESIRLEMKVEK